MILSPRVLPTSTLKRASLASVLATASICAQALPTFTLDPSAVGLAGSSFTADNLLISNYSTVTTGSAGAFTETGYLSVTGVQLGGGPATAPGMNAGYGMYVQFTGSGTTFFGTDPMTGPTLGTLDTLNYTLYGYNGTATFGFDASNMPTTSVTGGVVLATGSLVPGTGNVTTTVSPPSFSPSANATLTMDTTAGGAFFVSPTPFMTQALTSFSNTSSQVVLFDGGFMIRQGGGSINFAEAVPEPETYALLGAGLVVVAFLSRRRGMSKQR